MCVCVCVCVFIFFLLVSVSDKGLGLWMLVLKQPLYDAVFKRTCYLSAEQKCLPCNLIYKIGYSWMFNTYAYVVTSVVL